MSELSEQKLQELKSSAAENNLFISSFLSKARFTSVLMSTEANRHFSMQEYFCASSKHSDTVFCSDSSGDASTSSTSPEYDPGKQSSYRNRPLPLYPNVMGAYHHAIGLDNGYAAQHPQPTSVHNHLHSALPPRQSSVFIFDSNISRSNSVGTDTSSQISNLGMHRSMSMSTSSHNSPGKSTHSPDAKGSQEKRKDKVPSPQGYLFAGSPRSPVVVRRNPHIERMIEMEKRKSRNSFNLSSARRLSGEWTIPIGQNPSGSRTNLHFMDMSQTSNQSLVNGLHQLGSSSSSVQLGLDVPIQTTSVDSNDSSGLEVLLDDLEKVRLENNSRRNSLKQTRESLSSTVSPQRPTTEDLRNFRLENVQKIHQVCLSNFHAILVGFDSIVFSLP